VSIERMANILWLDGKGDFLDIMTENQISADSDILRIHANAQNDRYVDEC